MNSASSGRYKSAAGNLFFQREPVRVLVVISKEELVYWAGVFDQMTAFFRKQKNAVIDIQVAVAHNATEALTYVSADHEYRMHLVISRLHLRLVFNDGVFDLLRAIYAGHTARMIQENQILPYPSVIMYDQIDSSVPETLTAMFEEHINAGAVFKCFDTSTPQGKKTLVRQVIRVIAKVLDSSFSTKPA